MLFDISKYKSLKAFNKKNNAQNLMILQYLLTVIFTYYFRCFCCRTLQKSSIHMPSSNLSGHHCLVKLLSFHDYGHLVLVTL